MNELKFLFTAFYLNGESFAQPASDRSVIDPSKSAFFDVDRTRLVSFQLSGAGRLAEVNLFDGRIFLDGKIVHPAMPGQGAFELVYFRRNTVSVTIGVGQTHDRAFHLGWTHPVLGTQEVVLC